MKAIAILLLLFIIASPIYADINDNFKANNLYLSGNIALNLEFGISIHIPSEERPALDPSLN